MGNGTATPAASRARPAGMLSDPAISTMDEVGGTSVAPVAGKALSAAGPQGAAGSRRPGPPSPAAAATPSARGAQRGTSGEGAPWGG